MAISLKQIKNARTEESLRLLEEKIKEEMDLITKNPDIKNNLKLKAKMDYLKKIRLIKSRKKSVKKSKRGYGRSYGYDFD